MNINANDYDYDYDYDDEYINAYDEENPWAGDVLMRFTFSYH